MSLPTHSNIVKHRLHVCVDYSYLSTEAAAEAALLGDVSLVAAVLGVLGAVLGARVPTVVGGVAAHARTQAAALGGSQYKYKYKTRNIDFSLTLLQLFPTLWHLVFALSGQSLYSSQQVLDGWWVTSPHRPHVYV